MSVDKKDRTGLVSVIAALAIMFLIFGINMYSAKAEGYIDFAYEKACEWNSLEVGSILRRPQPGLPPSGRMSAVIVFPKGDISRARVLRSFGGGEIPRHPKFLGLTNSAAVFQETTGSDSWGPSLHLELTKWESFPLRSESSSSAVSGYSIKEVTPGRGNE